MEQNILLLGAGNMGRTYAESFLATHWADKSALCVLEKNQTCANVMRAQGIANVYEQPGPFVGRASLLLFAVKPQDRFELYAQMAEYMHPNQLVLSIMAGVTMSELAAELPTQKIVRAMPNLPAQIGMGMTGYCATASVSKQELLLIQNLLSTTGKAIYFENEEKIDAVTAISGSGPAYVFYFMEAMTNSALKMGFSRQEAELLVEQTFLGASHLIGQHQFGCSEWIEKVASKGGTTQAALDSFAGFGLGTNIGLGLEAALQRAKELGQPPQTKS